MKTLYITILVLAGSTLTFAQQNKQQEEKQTATQETLDKFAVMNEAQKAKHSNTSGSLVSEQGLEKAKPTSSSSPKATSGKLLPSTATMEEIIANIPNRKKL